MKHLFTLLLIFTIGGVGGIFFDRFAIPELAQTSLGERFPILRQAASRTTVVNKTEILQVEESEAIPDLAERVKGTAIPIEFSVKEKGRTKNVEASRQVSTGLALTNDGYILFNGGGAPIVTSTIRLAEDPEAELDVVVSDTSTGFLLLHAPGRRFSVLPFEEDRLRLGSRLFAISAERVGDAITPSFQASMLSSLTSDFFTLSQAPQQGAILVNFEGRVVGMAVEREGMPETVSAGDLKQISDMLLKKGNGA